MTSERREPASPGPEARLRELLLRLRVAEDERLRGDWDRSLSFADGLFDRWERARRLGFGEGASIYDSALVFGDVRVGEQSWIGPYTLLDGSGGGIEIGSYCSVSTGVQIYTHDTVMWALSGGRAERRTAATRIGDRCHLGAQSIVAAGVTLGSQCVVAANSFVNRSFPDGTVVGGTPAEVLGRVRVEGDEIVLDYSPPGEGPAVR